MDSAKQPGNALAAVTQEIMQEQAASLGRCGRKFQRAVELCARLETEIAAIERRLAPTAARRGLNAYAEPRETLLARWRDLIHRFNRSRNEAARQFYYLVVQREAIGFRSHREVERLYHLPPLRVSPFLASQSAENHSPTGYAPVIHPLVPRRRRSQHGSALRRVPAP